MFSASRRRRSSSAAAHARPAACVDRLEGRVLFTIGPDGYPDGPAFKYGDPPAGWRVTVDERSSGDIRTGATLTLTGPDTPDTVLVTRNPTLPTGLDFEINGRKMTINFRHGDIPHFGKSWEIFSGGGDDRVELALGMADSFSGGVTVDGGDGNDVLIGGDTGGHLHGGAGDDVLVGGRGSDTLRGTDGIDQLFGRGGDDFLDPGFVMSTTSIGWAPLDPREVSVGGPGFDRTYTSYSTVHEPPHVLPGPVVGELIDPDPAPPLPVEVTPRPHDPRLPFSEPPEDMNVHYNLMGDYAADLRITGTPGDDVIRLTQNAQRPSAVDVEMNGGVMTVTIDPDPLKRRIAFYFDTGDGNDVMTVDLPAGYPMGTLDIQLGKGDDQVAQVGSGGLMASGGLGNDVLRGGPAGNYLTGGEGVDSLYGGTGNDTLHAGNLESRWPAVFESGFAPTEPGEVFDPGTGRDLVITKEGETRYLDGVPQPDEPEAPPEPPPIYVNFDGPATVRRGKAYTFSVTYVAPEDTVRRETAGDDDLLVTGPGGFSANATLVRARPKGKGMLLVARYRVAAPGGRFDAADNGQYSVLLGSGVVTSATGRVPRIPGGGDSGAAAVAEAEAAIGRFTVDARARRVNSVTPVGVETPTQKKRAKGIAEVLG